MGTHDPLGQLVNYWYKSMRCSTKIFFEELLYWSISKKKMGDLLLVEAVVGAQS
jgi:hypothetical protein